MAKPASGLPRTLIRSLLGLDPNAPVPRRKTDPRQDFPGRSHRSDHTLHTMTTPDDPAQTWHDTANRLTAAQIACRAARRRGAHLRPAA
jgi:hypothetical protein